MHESSILYENGRFWVCRAVKGFEVYENAATHSRLCALIGYDGQKGFDRAKAEADRRATTASPTFKITHHGPS